MKGAQDSRMDNEAEMNKISRRQFGSMAAAICAAGTASPLWARSKAVGAGGSKFRIALVADTHIIDGFYVKGSENGQEDNESILHTSDRLTAARDAINALQPAVERVFILGDYFHNYPSTDYEFYFKNRTRLDNAKAITDGFRMPVHLGFGNHDYAVRTVEREMSHRLFKAKFGAEPYSSVDAHGVRFIQANNFLGVTQDRHAEEFRPQTGSLGEVQLQWLEAQLAARKPTYVFLHYPLIDVLPTEFKDFGLHLLLRKYKDSIRLVVTGHYHKWIDYAHTYGPQHYVMASTRYDAHAEMFLEIDGADGSYRWLNEPEVDWSTHFAKAYRQG